ncbi:Ig-like domain-containing protein [Rhodococcus sp. IEGM 1318]|uniref:phage major capsid protein n=1 Tax=Rhodococcus sp. IEGM 1318 TaxID=3082226 RepID=UPI002954A12E|nr:Ig-like domain-containing protein [Rhodococcus sp. IEGM 1318]MDV8003851.1 Ig-like domain-containing protein [Rhodococcus sp. IEGM 1318]
MSDNTIQAADSNGPLRCEAVSLPTDAVAVETRVINGLALPYGIPGITSGGKVTVQAGAIKIPEDMKRVKLLRNHDRESPVGYLESIEDGPNGLVAKFKVGNTEAGNIALVEAAEGIRDGLSVELSAVQMSADGKTVISALLDAVALVAVPAFSDARVSSVLAQKSDSPASAGGSQKETEMELTPEQIAAAEKAASDKIAAEAKAAEVEAAQKLLNPGGVLAPKKSEITFSQVVQALHAVRNGDMNDTITAALADITRSANTAVSPAGWVGEVWSGVQYNRVIVPLVTNKSLTSYRAVGWRWLVKPEVASYAGDKNDVPSNQPTTEAVNIDALRLAGAHDIDRKFIDFNDSEFIAAYFSAMAESYAYETDEALAAFIAANASAAGAAEGILKAVALAAQRVKLDTRAPAAFVLVNPEDHLELINVSANDVPAFLELLGVSPSAFVASQFVPKGQVIVGAKPAVEFYELGGSPIRVDAVSISNGGYDGALFGYHAEFLANAAGLVKVFVEASGWTLDLTPATATIAVAGTQLLVVKDNSGNVIPNKYVTFTTSNPARATVNSAGVVTGVATGAAATITATYQGKTDTAAITVS